ncbi:MAG: MerR family transcriptional regulator [Acholeplasmataceae bacterium]|jgi:DNA-binding transcriptional MerR regulator|nr:MerR family transcriptional regulator [Acholeplasmataceae bacterium]
MMIGEVSKQFDITEDTLRYYEKIGLIRDVKRKNGIRSYDENDILTIEFIICMRSAGLSIEFLSQYLTLLRSGDETIDERKNLLIEQRKLLIDRISDMNKTLKRLDYKIEIYDEMMKTVHKDFK